MSTQTYLFGEQRGLVFETHCPGQLFVYDSRYEGHEVSESAPPLQELVASGCFVLPPLAPVRGSYNVLTLARGLPARPPERPRYWDPVELAEIHGGVYLRVSYDAAEARLGFHMNAGGTSPALEGVSIEGLEPAMVARRVIHFVALVREDVIYAGIAAEDGAEPDLFFHDQKLSTGGPLHPWGAPAAGHWWLTSGGRWADEDPSLAFPPGFGLSDLRVWFRTGPEAIDASPAYSGALDHLRPRAEPSEDELIADLEPFDPGDDDSLFDPEAYGVLFDLASELRAVAAGAEILARRSDDCAEWAEHLALARDPWAEMLEGR